MYSPEVHIERGMLAEDFRSLVDAMGRDKTYPDLVERPDGEVIHTHVFVPFLNDRHLNMVADVHTMAAKRQNAVATTYVTEDLRGKSGFEGKEPRICIVIKVEAPSPGYSVDRFHDDALTLYNSCYPPR